MLDSKTLPGEVEALRASGRLDYRPGRDRREPPAWIASPPRRRTGAAPIVVVHGITRNADEIAVRLAARAAAQGRVLIAPLFSENAFRRYQLAVCADRADQALLGLLDALVDDGAIDRGPVALAGFSGGAQFAHRFAWLYPHRVGRLTVASAGWWTFPDDSPFPYGLGAPAKGPRDAPHWLRANMTNFLDREIVVCVGAQDCVKDAKTRSGPRIDAQQGHDRLTRARRWSQAIAAAAKRCGATPRIAFEILPGCGHDFASCADAGLARLIAPGLDEPTRLLKETL